MRKIIGIYCCFLLFYGLQSAHAGTPPYKGTGDILDAVYAYISIDGAEHPQAVRLLSENSAVPGYNYYDGDAEVLGGPLFNFIFSKAYDEKQFEYRDLLVDFRPYSPYYVDFPLSIVVESRAKVGTEYKLRITPANRPIQDALTFVAIIDKLNPDLPLTNRLEATKNGSSLAYTFHVTDEELVPEVGTTRFRTERLTVRVYGSELPVASTEELDWNQASSWISGHIPGENSHVVIPENIKMAVRETPASSIELLTNQGKIEIRKDASFQVTGEIELIPDKGSDNE